MARFEVGDKIKNVKKTESHVIKITSIRHIFGSEVYCVLPVDGTVKMDVRDRILTTYSVDKDFELFRQEKGW